MGFDYTLVMSWTVDADYAFGKSVRVRRYQWPTGLQVIVAPDHSAAVFSYQTWFRVGSRHERPGKTGMAHFFEHLMFGATVGLAPGELDRLIEQTGGDNNAATWNDWTYYRTSLPAKDLELAVRLESERMQHLVLDDDPIETERVVVMNERLERVEDDVDGFLDEKLHELAFTTHPYRWPTIGWMDDIRALDKGSVQRFYQTYYTPNNATIVIVGDFDERRALDLIARYYGHIPPAKIAPEETMPEPEQREERRARFPWPVRAERLVMGYKIPGQSHPDWVVAEFIAHVLTGGASSRLSRRLTVDTEIATSVDCTVPPFRDTCLFRVSVNLSREHSADVAIAVIDEVMAELAREPLPEAELMKIKNCAETDFWSFLEDMDGKGEALGHYETALGDFRELFRVAERLGTITAEDVMRVAREHLVPERRTIVIAEPGEEEEDDDDDQEDGDIEDANDEDNGAGWNAEVSQ